MGTIVTITIDEQPPTHAPAADAERGEAIDRAFGWFREIERLCNRFDPDSELRRITRRPGEPAAVSEMLGSALAFALTVAEDTAGAFDPTVGRDMEARGFNRDYRTGDEVPASGIPQTDVSYRDVHLDAASHTIVVDRPLMLDLGAVAKGLAIDLAARELAAAFVNFVIDAGGDLYLAGRGPRGQRRSVGIRHPRRDREAIEVLQVADAAVCTSGDYEREAAPGSADHHILDPRRGESARLLASATVVAPTALLADALATAAFVLGPDEGIRLLERHGVEGVLYTPSLDRVATPGVDRYSTRG